MKHAFELNAARLTGPSPSGSLHAAASVNLHLPAQPAAPAQGYRVAPTGAPAAKAHVPLKPKPLVSFVVSTHNRRDVLLKTVDQIHRCGLKSDQYEILIVDNASTDGTSDALRQGHPLIHLLHQEYNAGPVSKNVAIRAAAGRYVVFLDDDSFPLPGAVARMMKHFDANPRLGAAVFTITLPDGSRECSAYPDVFIGCGTGFRRTALEQVGGLPDDFFMQAEEYDLSLRLLAAGYDIRTFDDLHVTHLKSPTARANERTTRLDVRNNLVLITRYFPRQWVLPFAKDWLRRYRLIAHAKGHEFAYYRGLLGGLMRTMRPSNRRPVDQATFEKLVRLEETAIRMARAVYAHRLKRVLFIDFGKNMLPYYLAAQRCGVQVVAIADEKLGGEKRNYRNIPLFKDAAARVLQYDAAIVSNLSPVHAAQRRDAWRKPGTRLVIDLFEDDRYASAASGGVGGVTSAAAPASPGSRQTVARSA
jgi:GT2 family glycosyltransferase